MATQSEKKENVKQDVTWQQVLLALAVVLVFGLSFAFTFEYYAQAKHSLEANIVGPANCTVQLVTAGDNVTCSSGAAAASPCYTALVNVGIGGVSLSGSECVLLESYHDYYSTVSPRCSFTQCGHGRSGGGRRPGVGSIDSATNASFPCWFDLNKPSAAFLELQDDQTNRRFFSKSEAYAILVIPPIGMGVSVLVVVGCIVAGKVRAGELLQPVVTPNHVEIGGKWYLRSPKASPVEPEDKWQHLKEALQ